MTEPLNKCCQQRSGQFTTTRVSTAAVCNQVKTDSRQLYMGAGVAAVFREGAGLGMPAQGGRHSGGYLSDMAQTLPDDLFTFAYAVSSALHQIREVIIDQKLCKPLCQIGA